MTTTQHFVAFVARGLELAGRPVTLASLAASVFEGPRSEAYQSISAVTYGARMREAMESGDRWILAQQAAALEIRRG